MMEWVTYRGDGECPLPVNLNLVVRYAGETRDEAEYWCEALGSHDAWSVDWLRVKEYRILGGAA